LSHQYGPVKGSNSIQVKYINPKPHNIRMWDSSSRDPCNSPRGVLDLDSPFFSEKCSKWKFEFTGSNEILEFILYIVYTCMVYI
jgi:hypothetical protein